MDIYDEELDESDDLNIFLKKFISFFLLFNIKKSIFENIRFSTENLPTRLFTIVDSTPSGKKSTIGNPNQDALSNT